MKNLLMRFPGEENEKASSATPEQPTQQESTGNGESNNDAGEAKEEAQGADDAE